jgi:hypothetical protein
MKKEKSKCGGHIACYYRFTDIIHQHGSSPNGMITLAAFKKVN